MSAMLYLVPTPIGNLSDISERCREVLAQADFIAAEDTRVTLRLLNHLELKKPLVSYYEHNKAASGPRIVERILAGETCALVSDAGSPAISDPGEDLVRLCAEAGVTVSAIPGPCAAITALSMSGLPTGRFTFEGFLSTTKKNRAQHLDSLRAEQRTMIFYEAPHKLCATLRDLAAAFGGERRISLCRELTKLHEEVLRLTLDGAVAYYETQPPRGEDVLIVEGAPKQQESGPVSEEEALMRVQALLAEGLSGRFVRMDAKRFGVIPGVTDREYYTNSFHVPVYYPISAFDKLRIEAPYHALTNGGHISYIEMDGDPLQNLPAFEKVVRFMGQCGIGYGSINHPVDRDPVCGFNGIIGDTCPRCGRRETPDQPFERIRRITGYLVGTLDRFNNGKRAEERDRVKHGVTD